MNITDLIAWVSVVGAAVVFVAGLVDLIMTWSSRTKAQAAITAGAAKTTAATEATGDELKEYAGLNLKDSWDGLASLATALKDLDRSSRLFMLSLAFLAVAGATVGLQAIGTGLAGIGS